MKKSKRRLKNWSLHLMLLPALILLLVYNYIPLVGNVMAFQNSIPQRAFSVPSGWD